MPLSERVPIDAIVSTILESPVKACAASLAAISIGYVTIKGLQYTLLKSDPTRSYPPGPPRDFLIGAMRSFPKDFPLARFNEWAVTYGDIVYAPVPGMKLIILNSYEVAQEFLAKRPNSTAGRFVSYLVGNLMGWNWPLSLKQPGPGHSNQRKMLRRGIGPQRVGSHDALIETETAKFITTLTTFEGDPKDIVHGCIGRFVSKATYGEQIWDEMGQDLSHWNSDSVDNVSEAAFSFWLVDVLHFLRFIPDWVPGLRFKQLIREGQEISHNIRYKTYRRSLELYKSGMLGHSILNDLLDEFGDCEDTRDATSMLYGAGADTTSAGVVRFLHALFLHPDIANHVFKEIQSVTQGLRLPQFTDRSRLPYTEAVWKESVRWNTFFPIGIPHVVTQDETLRGYFIPKGTIIHQNTMMMLNDPKIWGDPEVFRPERFLEPDAAQKPNPFTALFGWGLRVCPGMYLADRTVFHIVATIASLYKLEPLDGKKLPDPQTVTYIQKLVQLPVDFECRFVVRDEKAENLLKAISIGG